MLFGRDGELLYELYRKKTIEKSSQKIFKSNVFYKKILVFEKLGWVKKEISYKNGLKKYRYSITIEGALIFEATIKRTMSFE